MGQEKGYSMLYEDIYSFCAVSSLNYEIFYTNFVDYLKGPSFNTLLLCTTKLIKPQKYIGKVNASDISIYGALH